MILSTSLINSPSDVINSSSYLSYIPTKTKTVDHHPSRLKMTIQDYLVQVWQKMKETEGCLSLIFAKIDKNCPQKRMKLDQLAKVMRSLVQGVDDFVGFGEEDEVIIILPKTDLGEAVQILYQIHNYYSDEVEKLEVISANPQENSTIQPLLSKIWGDSYQFN